MPILPTTRLGRRAALLALAGVLLGPAWSVLPGGASLGFALEIAGGVAALVAILRRQERALTVFAALVPLVFVVAFVVAEFAVGHE